MEINRKAFFAKREEKILDIKRETQPFNYVSLHIRSEVFLKGYLVAEIGEEAFIWQDFFVEPTDETVSFFLEDERAASVCRLIRIRFNNLENKAGNVEIYGVETKMREKFCGKRYYANSFLCMGFDADLGPVISYLSSSKYRIRETDDARPRILFEAAENVDGKANCNLINTYDNGRFPQQSYSGASLLPYQANVYKDTVWVFNPVQAGDHAGFHSRIADYRLEKDGVYFKIRPLDWAKRNSPLDCYMEVSYALGPAYVRVSNRFVDFSMLHVGLEQKPVRQELPTFNTLASLGSFAYPLSNRKNAVAEELDFWGDEDTNERLFFKTPSCWSGWVNEAQYGVGLLTPGITDHFAGKFGANRRYRGPSHRSEFVNHVAGVVNFNLESLAPIRYDFYLSVGHLDEIGRAVASVQRGKTAGRQSRR